MRQLRHVKCDKVYIHLPHPRNGQDCMEKLQLLKGAVNLRMSEEVCEIIPNIKKLQLLYDPKKQGYDDSLIECVRNLDRLHKLESLDMEIMTSYWPYGDPKLISKLAFPISLNKLCLRDCGFYWEDLSIIGSLPLLQVLHLKYHTVNTVGGLWSPISGQFLRLKFLEIENCGLRTWDADNSHFPVLKKLVLRDLSFLEEIPPEIGEIPTLGLIRLDSCSESATISAVKIKKDQLESQDNDALEIEVGQVFNSDVGSFKKRLEAEELSLNLLKLNRW